MKSIILSTDDLRTIVRHVGLDRLMDEVIEGLTAACCRFDPQTYAVPVRAGFECRRPQEGLLEWMPVMENGRQATIKVVGYHPTNPERERLPTILSVALTFDTESGHLLGLVDGTFPTAMRTGAASAVASKILASRHTRVLGLIGCGAQAVTQLHALSRVIEFREVLVYDSDPNVSQSFLERIALLNLSGVVVKVSPLEQVVSAADILCTATSVGVGKGPVFEDAGLKPSLHINAIGSDFPGKTEMPLSLLRRSFVCPDFRQQAIKEGECQQLQADDIGPDLVELVRDSHEHAWRREQPTLFDSTGWAVEDHVVIGILVRHARDLGCGALVQVESVSDDPKNPYGFVESERNSRGQDAAALAGQGRLLAVE